jgi:sirohydrochlorin cobaltochelatase
MVIFVAHGSRDSRWRASVEAVVEALRAELGPDAARIAYMDCAPPTLMEVATDAAAAGATRIRVVPLFLADEGHVERDVRPMVDAVAAALAGVDVQLLPAMGRHPAFLDMLRDIVERASA